MGHAVGVVEGVVSQAAAWGLEPGLMADFIDEVSRRLERHLVGSARSIACDIVDDVRAYRWALVLAAGTPDEAARTRFAAKIAELMYEVWGPDNHAMRLVIDEVVDTLAKMDVNPVQEC